MAKKSKKTATTTPDLVSYSRAGDTFHYRWAARRCLRLLEFNSPLKHITIEGSKESKLGGEYIIDTAEYSSGKRGGESVEYFQLKHSTTQCHKDFTLSDLKDTIVGFSNRYKDLEKEDEKFSSVTFTIITNRPISANFKKSILKLATGESGGVSFDKTIKAYTGLQNTKLAKFCSHLQLSDAEGNYDAQKHTLHREIAALACDTDDVSQMLKLVELVRERIEPGSKKQIINKDDVLEQFGLTSEKDLFPAPPQFELLPSVIIREQYDNLYRSIIDSTSPFSILTAVGGTGKSITCNQLSSYFTNGSLALSYDCFGNGGYRKISEHRHRACDAYVQIANELARKGLCEPLLPMARDQDDRLTQAFLARLSQAILKLRVNNKNALLTILFDAVDNAEMAAIEFGDRCFARYLLRETLPDGCRIVYLSRPERIHLFNPPAAIKPIKITPFNDKESLEHLQKIYPDASRTDAVEFRRLTDGNPRVQSNALAINMKTVSDLLAYFTTGSRTVDDLIEEQLNNAVIRIEEQYPIDFKQQVEDICTGLASLPPFVPIEVLAAASGADISAVKSFIADLGRPLWLTDNYVQFRDEPTESWFISTYIADPEKIKIYISRLEPLAKTFPYVAEALPSLLLKSDQYGALIKLALSEDKLPANNPVEARSIQLYRLQFAFKAALKNQRYLDACKLALRAGEEVAGTERQMDILSNNIDLSTQFLSPQRIMELAHQRDISGDWTGSETIYSASLLATLPECEGEARSYLRSGKHWLYRYFEDRNKEEKKNPHNQDKLEDRDVLAIFSCIFYIDGENAAIEFIQKWSPDELIYRVTCMFAMQLVDSASFDILERMALLGKNCPSIVIAITHELMKVGRTPDKKCLTRTLNKIVGKDKWLSKSKSTFDTHHITSNAYLSLLEACVINQLPVTNIKRALNYYLEDPEIYDIDRDYHNESISIFLRSISVRAYISNNYELSTNEVTPKSWVKEKKSYDDNQKIKKCKSTISALLPWYMIRAKLLAGKRVLINECHKQAQDISSSIVNSRYQQYDPLPFEITAVRFFNLVLSNTDIEQELNTIINGLHDDSIKFRFMDKINALRIANRQPKLEPISDALENSCYKIVKIIDEEETPLDHANNLILLSRAVLSSSKIDAEAYFESAIEAVSRFGDEGVERWEAINKIAKHSALKGQSNTEVAYRFMRCAELIGDSVQREKHWNRHGAMETCFQLSPESAFAIASRWKDREIGSSDRSLSALVSSSLSHQTIPPASVWALSAFSLEDDLVKLAERCIEKETDNLKKEYIFNNVIMNYRQQGILGASWKEIQRISIKYNFTNDALKDVNLLIGNTQPSPAHRKKLSIINDDISESNDKLYGDINFLSDSGLGQAIDILYTLDGMRDFEGFWKYVTSKISSSDAVKYLSLIADSEHLDLYNIRDAIRYLPDNFRIKPSIQRKWPSIIKSIAKRFPDDFIRCYSRESVLNDIGTDAVTVNSVNEGILEGLSTSNGLESASTFYGFSGYYASLISTEEAEELLDFALTRFEIHINDEYADGNWSQKLTPPTSIVDSFTGYLWACLGSPKSSERWRAMHAVRKLYDLNCGAEIDALIEWLLRDHADSFTGKNYLFYNKHARLYLLMALARCAIDDPSLLTKHQQVFIDIVIKDEPHILIQKYAADIALSIENIKLDILDEQVLIALKSITKSSLPTSVPGKRSETTDTPWHKQNAVDTSLDLSFAHDFDRYWFKSLGQVFGLASLKIHELASVVVLKDWKLSFSERYMLDPRQELWSLDHDRDTWHDHSSYPKTDKYDFYLSYHAIMTVAAKLLNAMPIVHPSGWDENPWESWLDSHSLTRKDQRWLADRRDFIPVARRQWLNDKIDNDWRWQVSTKDFLEILLFEYGGTTWLNMAGSWNQYKDGHNEEFYISSRLVPAWASTSLQRAITYFDDHTSGMNSLAAFDVNDYENSEKHPFKLKQWYQQEDCYKKIDELDPHAGAIEYPPYILSEDIAEQLCVTPDDAYSHWTDNNDEILVKNQSWSENRPIHTDNDYCNKGNNLQASINFLTAMCKKLDLNLVIQVDIKRQLTGSYRDRNNDIGYLPPYRKIYILSKDGRLRDATKTFELRKEVNK